MISSCLLFALLSSAPPPVARFLGRIAAGRSRDRYSDLVETSSFDVAVDVGIRVTPHTHALFTYTEWRRIVPDHALGLGLLRLHTFKRHYAVFGRVAVGQMWSRRSPAKFAEAGGGVGLILGNGLLTGEATIGVGRDYYTRLTLGAGLCF